MDVNPDKLNAFIGKMLGDVGAAMGASTVWRTISIRSGAFSTPRRR